MWQNWETKKKILDRFKKVRCNNFDGELDRQNGMEQGKKKSTEWLCVGRTKSNKKEQKGECNEENNNRYKKRNNGKYTKNRVGIGKSNDGKDK